MLKSVVMGIAVMACIALALWAGRAIGKESTEMSKAAAPTATTQEDVMQKIADGKVKTEIATFGAGCFWGSEATFRQIDGVLATEVGYEGGSLEKPTYHDVCTDRTGHAEVVQVTFDPTKVSYQRLLEVFFENHDPTTMNRQGPDAGAQYRSAILYHSPEQEKLAEAEKAKRNASGEYVGPIVTEVTESTHFWPAEQYHQQYFEKKGVHYSCHLGNGKKK